MAMNLDNASQKQLNELEQLTRQMLVVLRQAKLHDEPLSKSLYELEQQLGDIRRQRFDAANPQDHSY